LNGTVHLKTFTKTGFFSLLVLLVFLPCNSNQEEKTGRWSIARIHYKGGGDWYADPGCLSNLCLFIRENTTLQISEEKSEVLLLEDGLFSFPLLFITGHGRIIFSQEEAARLREYLLHGGFLYADDDYGMDSYFRSAMRTVFPNLDFIELPFSHGIFDIQFPFPRGLPKIHEHNNKPPQGFGLFDENGRLMVFYTFETNISDGWADPQTYKDPEETRQEAFRMGTNIVVWALIH
jgi:hypothetical protein